MTRRTYLGKLSGSFALRTTLPGFDAITDDATDSEKFSFNSDWTDLVNTHQVGIATQDGTTSAAVSVPFTSPGYKPIVEVRYISGSVIYDDTNVYDSLNPGWNTWVTTNSLILQFRGSDQPYSLLYVIYKIPVPTQ